jgi:hypothetical protein
MSEIDVVNLESERAKVESWRLHVLLEAGYPFTRRRVLAPDGGRDPALSGALRPGYRRAL